MELTYIILPKKLGERLREKAEAEGYLSEELGVELLQKSLNEELDPEDLVEQYKACICLPPRSRRALRWRNIMGLRPITPGNPGGV